MVLLYNPSCKNQTKINPSLYQSIKTTDFIHRVYIECARELWNNPYLMYHEYPPIEIKRNQRDCMLIIKESIKESLRKLLPVKHILQVYLGEDININNSDEQFDKAISDVEENYLPKLINKDLSIANQVFSENKNSEKKTTENNNTEKSQGSIILDIIKNTPNPISKKSETLVNISDTSVLSEDIMSINSKTKNPVISIKNNSDTTFSTCKKTNSINNKIINNIDSKNNIDQKIKNILKNDLAVESDNIDTSLSYNNYQEIFSNSYEINK
jgi:hypothetical protein